MGIVSPKNVVSDVLTPSSAARRAKVQRERWNELPAISPLLTIAGWAAGAGFAESAHEPRGMSSAKICSGTCSLHDSCLFILAKRLFQTNSNAAGHSSRRRGCHGQTHPAIFHLYCSWKDHTSRQNTGGNFLPGFLTVILSTTKRQAPVKETNRSS